MSLEPGKVEIRDLRESDLATVIALAELLEDAPDWPPEIYAALLRPGAARPRIVLVAGDTRGGEVLGFVVASLAPPEAELESIAVAPLVQRQGIGRRLLASLVTQLRTSGIGELHLEVRASNHAALAFYGAQNFNQIGVRPRYYTDPEEDAILMIRLLI
jgi:[ribosomal protein S18]-alanine N-acetyltransferase